MGWLISAGQLGAKRAAPMRITASDGKRGWAFGESDRHNRLTLNRSNPAATKAWQAVLSGLTDSGCIEQSEQSEQSEQKKRADK